MMYLAKANILLNLESYVNLDLFLDTCDSYAADYMYRK
jgi:hypothetical protein